MREDEAGDLKRGTRITLHLKPDAKDLADAEKLGALIKQYSEFIQFPIKLYASKTEYDQVRRASSATRMSPVQTTTPCEERRLYRCSADKHVLSGGCNAHSRRYIAALVFSLFLSLVSQSQGTLSGAIHTGLQG